MFWVILEIRGIGDGLPADNPGLRLSRRRASQAVTTAEEGTARLGYPQSEAIRTGWHRKQRIRDSEGGQYISPTPSTDVVRYVAASLSLPGSSRPAARRLKLDAPGQSAADSMPVTAA